MVILKQNIIIIMEKLVKSISLYRSRGVKVEGFNVSGYPGEILGAVLARWRVDRVAGDLANLFQKYLNVNDIDKNQDANHHTLMFQVRPKVAVVLNVFWICMSAWEARPALMYMC